MRDLAAAEQIDVAKDRSGRIVAAIVVNDRSIVGTRIEWERHTFHQDGTYSTKPMTGEVVGVDCVDMQTVWVQPDHPKSAKPTVVGIHQG